MPEMDGLTACTKIREFSNVPIILLTAKVADIDKLMGFEHGTDDYLTKPFNILELKARVKALLRRANTQTQEEPAETLPEAPEEPLVLCCSEVTLIQEGQSIQLYTGSRDRNQIVWSSSDSQIVTVEDGLVKLLMPGVE